MIETPGLIIPILVKLRFKVKQTVQQEDLVACGMLLALAVLAYIQQQPMSIIFFDHRHLTWDDYYKNAPVLILAGIGFLRLNKTIGWQGVYSMGTIILMAGCILVGGALYATDG